MGGGGIVAVRVVIRGGSGGVIIVVVVLHAQGPGDGRRHLDEEGCVSCWPRHGCGGLCGVGGWGIMIGGRVELKVGVEV